MSNLAVAEARAQQMEDVHLAIGQLFYANNSILGTMLWSRLERFLECAHRHVPADVNVTAKNFANGSYELFLGGFFHDETVCARAQRALCEDCFLKGGI